jgi:hypothetical protein
MVRGERRQMIDGDARIIEGVDEWFMQVIHMSPLDAGRRSPFQLIVMSLPIMKLTPPCHGLVLVRVLGDGEKIITPPINLQIKVIHNPAMNRCKGHFPAANDLCTQT